MSYGTYGTGRRRKGKKSDFNPTHEFVSTAIDKFLNGGGKVRNLNNEKMVYADFMAGKSVVGTADSFLMGEL